MIRQVLSKLSDQVCTPDAKGLNPALTGFLIYLTKLQLDTCLSTVGRFNADFRQPFFPVQSTYL